MDDRDVVVRTWLGLELAWGMDRVRVRVKIKCLVVSSSI